MKAKEFVEVVGKDYYQWRTEQYEFLSATSLQKFLERYEQQKEDEANGISPEQYRISRDAVSQYIRDNWDKM